MGLSSSIYAAIVATQSGAPTLGAETFNLNPAQKTIDLSNGTGNGQANLLWSSGNRVLAASGTENLDLAGVLTDAFGAVLTFASVKAIYVKAAATNTNDVVLGAGLNPVIGGPFGAAGMNTINVKPGGVFMWVSPNAGMAVTPATGDILKVLNSAAGTSVAYDIVIEGI